MACYRWVLPPATAGFYVLQYAGGLGWYTFCYSDNTRGKIMLKKIRNNIHIVCILTIACPLAMLVMVTGCGQKTVKPEIEKPIKLDITVGSLGRLYQQNAVPVHGYGIVAGLAGTGSAECPPALRPELIKYIWKQMPKNISIDAGKFIDSSNTAVVEIVGVIPPLASKGDHFDVKVQAFSRSQTTSLTGGRLYTVELKEAASFVGFGNGFL